MKYIAELSSRSGMSRLIYYENGVAVIARFSPQIVSIVAQHRWRFHFCRKTDHIHALVCGRSGAYLSH
jgi:hypothetical protein